MTKSQVHIDRLMVVAVSAAVLFVTGCADPARIVLYDERHKEPEAAPAAPAHNRTIVRENVTVPSVSQRQYESGPAGSAAFHSVRSGDTVYSVSQRYHVSIRGLITMNGMRAPYVLRRGQTLRLPKPRRHVVRSGDTIYGISRRYDVAVSRLVQRNDISPPYKIVVSRVLRLPDSIEPPASGVNAVTVKSLTTPEAPFGAGRQVSKATPPARSRNAVPPLRKAPIAVPKPPPLSKRRFLLPVRGRLLSRFGPKGRGLHNDGVNIAASRGAPVRAAENGIVVYSGNALLGFGNMVLLRHANGFMTAYAHNEAISVSRGDTVRRGQVIATVGSTGNVASPQLHFEIRKGKRAIDPAKFLPTLSASS